MNADVGIRMEMKVYERLCRHMKAAGYVGKKIEANHRRMAASEWR